MTSGIGRRRAAARDEGGAAYQERRTEIVRAAAEMFKKNGYRGTKLNDVAEAMGLDRASLYYYVGSKEELFHEVVGTAVETNADAAEQIATAERLGFDSIWTSEAYGSAEYVPMDEKHPSTPSTPSGTGSRPSSTSSPSRVVATAGSTTRSCWPPPQPASRGPASTRMTCSASTTPAAPPPAPRA